MNSKFAAVCAALMCIFLLTGCGDDGPTRYTVTGTVTYDGVPVEVGDVIFVDPDGQLAPDGAQINNGTFTATVQPGTKRVEIRAAKDVPGSAVDGSPPLREDYIPAKYNRESELTAEVSSSGGNDLTFDLEP